MAGITATSTSTSLSSGATSANAFASGWLASEEITLATSPAGTSYEWSLSAPGASVRARSALSSTTGASVTFTPDTSGTYLVRCVVDGSTTYTLRLSVLPVTISHLADAVRFSPVANTQVPTPAAGKTVYYSSNAGDLVSKDSAGNVVVLGGGGGSGDMLKATYDPNDDGVIAVAQGGTGATSASDARTALGCAYGTTAGTVCQGNDSRLSDARTPTAHAASHQSGGSDAIKLDDLAAPDDNTDLNASVSAHGLLPKLSGSASDALRGDGTWGAVAGGGGFPTADGTQAAPAWSFASDTDLGIYRIGANRLGFVRNNFVGIEFGDNTIANLEPVPATIRYLTRCYTPPLNGVNETACFYSRLEYTPTDNQKAFFYVEIDSSQVDTYGAAIKCIHNGHGDAFYVAAFSDGPAYEAASFADGSRGFISTLQLPNCPNSVLYNALWEQNDVPNYGMFYADSATANALTIHKRPTAALDGYTQIRIIEDVTTGGGRQRYGVYNDGSFSQNSLAATAGVTVRDSPEMRLNGAYWDGAQSRDLGYTWKAVVSGAGVASLRFYEVAPAGSTLLAILQKNGAVGQLDMQGGGLANCDTLTAYGSFSLTEAGLLALQLEHATAVDGDTAMFLARKLGGAWTLQRVTMGAVDSGGTNYRVLRVPN